MAQSLFIDAGAFGPPAPHAPTHRPVTGTDPLATAVAGSIAVGDVAAVGVGDSFARNDHRHALPAPVAPVDVTKAAASAGAAATVARADHKHDVLTAVAGAISVGDVAAEGAATSLARSDHQHGLPIPGDPLPVGQTNLPGVSPLVARADHVHALPEPVDGIRVFEDFISLTGVGNTGATVGTSGGTVVALSPALGDNVHPGVIIFSTAVSAAGRGVISWGATRHRIPAGVVGGRFLFEALLRVPTLADAVQDFFVNAGASDNVVGAQPTQGIVFRYDFPSLTWNGVLRIAAVDVDVQVGPAVVAGQWTRLRIDYDAAIGLRYFIASPSPGPLVQIGATVPLATVDPLAAVLGAFAPQVKLQKQLGIVARTLELDYVAFAYLVPNAR